MRCTVLLPGVDEQRPFLSVGMILRCRAVTGKIVYEFSGYVVDRKGICVHVDFLKKDFLVLAKAIIGGRININETGSTSKKVNAKIEKVGKMKIFHIRYTYQKDFFEAMRLALFLTIEAEGSGAESRTLFPNAEISLLKHLPIDVRTRIKKSSCNFLKLKKLYDNPENSDLWFDKTINDCQKKAIRMILSKENGLAPIVIHGPPGTGKTKTVVEAVNQILNLGAHDDDTSNMERNNKNRRILLTAPSDIACDVLCSRLSHTLDKNIDMLRMNLPQRNVNEIVLMEVLPYCNISKKLGSFELPDALKLKEFRVIVCTCAAASLLLVNGGLLDTFANHFQYIFVDEAGQALELESLIPLAVGRLNKGVSTIVLSGDPKQLEASVRSPVGAGFRFGKSLQERLMSMPLYNTVDFPESQFCFIQLNQNYRSHASILNFSSNQFYGGTLKACVDQNKANQFLKWKGLPRSNLTKDPFPLVIYDVPGEERFDGDSISFYNVEEADAVVKITKNLLDSPEAKCTPSDIVVMCAYWQQVRLVRQKLRGHDFGQIRVGVVDDYQGQEAPITILSCVLTQVREHVDQLMPLTGLLGNSKRINVALTRAIGLSIVVGSTKFMNKDTHFNRLLNYCSQNNAVLCIDGGSTIEVDNVSNTLTENKRQLKDYEDYADDEDLILDQMQDAAVFNLNNVKEAFGPASNPGGADYLTGFDAFYKEEKPFKGNSL